MVMPSKQRDDMNQAIVDYLESHGYNQTASVFRQEANVDENADPALKAQSAGLLEKKWTLTSRLQQKIINLEEKLKQVEKEAAFGGSVVSRDTRRIHEDWIPRPPERYHLTGHRMAVTKVIWDFESGEFERTLKGHTDSVQDVVFNSSGKLLASCSVDLTIKIWDFVNTYECLKTLKGHEHNISSISFLPNRDFILSGSRDKLIKLWDVTNGYCVQNFSKHTEWVRVVLVNEEGTFFASCSNDKIFEVTRIFYRVFENHWALDPEGKCKLGDVVVIRKLPEEKMIASTVPYLVEKVVFEHGVRIDPISKKRNFEGIYADEMNFRKQLVEEIYNEPLDEMDVESEEEVFRPRLVDTAKYVKARLDQIAELLERSMVENSKPRWLSTHIWHAKRFHMQPLWGFKLAIKSCQKSFRPNYRSSISSAVITDRSYLSFIQLTLLNNENLVLISNLLSKFCRKKSSFTFSNTLAFSGNLELPTFLFKPSENFDEFIGPCRFSWSLPNKLNIWLHPSIENDFLNEVYQLDEINIISPSKFNTKKDSPIELSVLRNKISRFQLIGPKALIYLNNVFKLVLDEELDSLECSDYKERVHFSEESKDQDSSQQREKRKKFDDEDDNDNNDDEFELPGTSKADKKHTLDSDEEDNADDYERLDMEKVEGQEDATQEYEGEIKIMPFNMNDDLEEGHFDAFGTFIYNKKEEIIRDAWLDNIEWDKAKDAAGAKWGKLNDDDKTDEKEEDIELKTIYSKLLELLEVDDTIDATLKKLNSQKGLSASEERKKRWAAKKAGNNALPIQNDLILNKIAELTSLADSLVSLGQMEAYQLGPVRIKEMLCEMEPKVEDLAKEAVLDMFAE
ncbi:Lissencephaly-1-like protein [Meloidogyne graminicola]|uniref:Lissencephaly-1-like protein n=1 Tax=Meloidogyne graminicola TaxID=189291 RepID=A0A8T0A270_9BILA|nr:Lissencephaly-1-like protein [Meloidogyne graminicola]